MNPPTKIRFFDDDVLMMAFIHNALFYYIHFTTLFSITDKFLKKLITDREDLFTIFKNIIHENVLY